MKDRGLALALLGLLFIAIGWMGDDGWYTASQMTGIAFGCYGIGWMQAEEKFNDRN